MAPVTDPYEAVVSFALPSNVDTVLIDGRILRRAGKPTAFDERQVIAQAREAALALRDKAGWPT
jgi:cytosine/adenosine deaminase-related metal-dependent hydrolase